MRALVGLVVDKEDEYLLTKLTWYVHKYKGYVEAMSEGKSVKLHRLIMGAKPGQVVDHINGNKLDNRRENLRICTQAQNCQNNRNVRKNKTSIYKGVSWHKRSAKWRAQIQLNRKKTIIGEFDCEKEAALAYDKKALELFGEYANLNFKEV